MVGVLKDWELFLSHATMGARKVSGLDLEIQHLGILEVPVALKFRTLAFRVFAGFRLPRFYTGLELRTPY